MINETDKETLKEAISLYGEKHQTYKAVEEMGELTCEIMRLQDGRTEPEFVQEEIADVIITMYQLAEIFGEREVRDMIAYKIERLASRIKEAKGKN